MPETNTPDEAVNNTVVGRQTPTLSRTQEYETTRGQECVDLYETTGKTALEWQKLLIFDILAVQNDGLWTHTKYGYSVPRRNGKSEILSMRALYGIQSGERILWTAHRTTTSHNAWEKMCDLLARTGLKEKEDYTTSKQFGLERIVMDEGYINFRTRSTKGGLGEGYDLLIIDEAQEYTVDQESALKYVVTDSKNPQTVFCGTPPTVTSSGTVFTKLRQSTLAGEQPSAGWSEWSVDNMVDPKNKEFWYETNPSLGSIFTERSVMDEVGPDDVDFNIQRLGLWLKYNQKSAITKTEWESLRAVPLPKLTGGLFAGVKFSQDGNSVSLSIAVKCEDGRIYVEAIDCRPVREGYEWMISFIKKARITKVAIDGASGQKILAEDLKREKAGTAVLPTVKDVITANALFESAIYASTLAHGDQPSVMQIVSNCDKRPIGSGGGFGYKAIIEGADITLLDSLILAHWLCSNAKEKRQQRISY